MSEARFRFSKDILRRLGEELNLGLDQGVLELAKNSYDADARICTIELIDADSAGGSIRVTDDGLGMPRLAIENGWLVLGKSPKVGVELTKKFKRIPVGSKGLGRLAALRLGSRVKLVTRPEDEPQYEYLLEIDWNDYEHYEVVEDVVLSIQRMKRSSPDAGTIITIENLRNSIRREDVKRLARGLLLLADPFEENPAGFRPRLKALEFEDLELFVQRRYFQKAEFHLVATLDLAGYAEAHVLDYKDEVLYSAGHREVNSRTPDKPYDTLAATFDLWWFPFGKSFAAQHPGGTQKEIREWLKGFGGVHLYVNGLRVAPYGSEGHDWLEMNLARVKSPELAPSTNNSIGRVSLVDSEHALQEKTDRTGLLEGKEFFELKRFCVDTLRWMQRERVREREERRKVEKAASPGRVAVAKKNVAAEVEKLPPKTRRVVQAALSDYEKAVSRQEEVLRKDVQLYRTISTVGITSAVFAHEAKQPIKSIHLAINRIERKGKEYLKSDYPNTLQPSVESIRKQINTIEAFSGFALSQLQHEKRRIGRVDIHKVIKDTCESMGFLLTQFETEVHLDLTSPTPYVRTSVAALESVFVNLLTNSLKFFEIRGVGDRAIMINTEWDDGTIVIHHSDTGPGIIGISTKDVWLPGETTVDGGTGLGLAVVKDTITELGGHVLAVAHGELQGADFILQFPARGE